MNAKRLLTVALLFLLAWIISYRLWESLPGTYSVREISYPAIGGMCPRVLYDRDGKSHNSFDDFIDDYSGPAPLFEVPLETLGLTANIPGCPDYPSQIDPTIAATGQPVYPVLLYAQFESESLKVGESYPFRAAALMAEYFPTRESWNAYMGLTDTTEITFTLKSTNFEFSPSNQETRPMLFGRNYPAHQVWSVAPMERASGDQFLIVAINGASVNAEAHVRVEVRDPLGMRSTSIAWLTGGGAVLAYALLQTKTVVDISSSLRKSRKENK